MAHITAVDFAGWVLFFALLVLLLRPLSSYVRRVFEREATMLDGLLVPLERTIYRCTAIDPAEEMKWTRYTASFLLFSLAGTVLLYALLRLQHSLGGYDPAHVTTPMTPDLAFNTAWSFATTTTWQAYSGETTMSYWSQIIGLTVQNFLAGAGGLAVGVAFIRGFARSESDTIGNFWVDLVRGALWILLPLTILGDLLLLWQGVPLNFSPYTEAHMLAGGVQTIAQGPVALLEFIKNLGTNGGGFFAANGAHPYENPTPLTNLIELLGIAAVPASLTLVLGHMAKRPRDGRALFILMAILFWITLLLCGLAESAGTPATAPAANMEGKEIRFGIGGSVLNEVVTSHTATGSTSSSTDSYKPLSLLVVMSDLLLGEIVFGGLGTGLFSMVMTVLVAQFLAGLMIGRTPEYLGKTVGPREIKYVMLFHLLAPIVVGVLVAVTVITPAGRAGLGGQSSAHDFGGVVVAYASSFANNGLACGSLSANNAFYNITTVIAMCAGRFGLAIPVLALAGAMARQRTRPILPGSLATDSGTFLMFVLLTAVVITGLSFLPTFALGPIAEQCRLGGWF